jgi:hypothetical protein
MNNLIVSFLLFLFMGSFLCGCVNSEAQLQQGISNVIDTAAIPAKIVVRQFDNALDYVANTDD